MKKMNGLAKLSLFIIGMILCTSNVFSQEKFPVESITSEWTFYKDVKGIKFHVKKEVYSSNGRLDVDYVVLKLENTTDKELTISYNLAVHYNEGCNGCNSTEYYKTLVIPAHSSIEGKMTDGNSPVVMLLVNPNQKNGLIPQFITTENLVIK